MYDTNYLANHLAAAVAGDTDRLFIEDALTGQTYSYADFFANAERMAAVLLDAGVEPGDRVAVQASKTVAMLELYLGTILAGAVFLPLNTAYTASEVSYFLNDAQPKVFVCDPKTKAALDAVAQSAGVSTVFTLDAQGHGTLTEARDQAAPGTPEVQRGHDDLGGILYTSGTTGRSTGAMLSHRALASTNPGLFSTAPYLGPHLVTKYSTTMLCC